MGRRREGRRRCSGRRSVTDHHFAAGHLIRDNDLRPRNSNAALTRDAPHQGATGLSGEIGGADCQRGKRRKPLKTVAKSHTQIPRSWKFSNPGWIPQIAWEI